MANVWTMILRPGYDALSSCLKNNLIIIGWGTNADVDVTDYNKLRENINKEYYNNSSNYYSAGQAAGMVYEFCKNIKQGDYVIIPILGYQFYLCQVQSEKYSCANGEYLHKVTWLNNGNTYSWKNAPAKLARACRTRRTLKNSFEALEDILKLVDNPNYLNVNPYTDLFLNIKQTINNYFKNGRLNPAAFQAEFIPQLLKAMGATKTENRSGIGDKGIDIIATFSIACGYSEAKIGIQTKYWDPQPSLNKDSRVVEQTINGALAENVTEAWIITTSNIDNDLYNYAEEEGNKNGILLKLIDNNELSEMIFNYIDKNYITFD